MSTIICKKSRVTNWFDGCAQHTGLHSSASAIKNTLFASIGYELYFETPGRLGQAMQLKNTLTNPETDYRYCFIRKNSNRQSKLFLILIYSPFLSNKTVSLFISLSIHSLRMA